jgi:hypothetical protein
VTLEGFLKHFKDKYDLELSMVSCGVSIVYSMFSSKAKERMQVVDPLPPATTPPRHHLRAALVTLTLALHHRSLDLASSCFRACAARVSLPAPRRALAWPSQVHVFVELCPAVSESTRARARTSW